MKLLKFLDQKGTVLVSDPLNQTILKNLVLSEYSVSELAKKLSMPTLKMWRRMQKLVRANLVEIARTACVGNMEKKMYRAVAAGFISEHQYFELKPKDSKLKDAFKIYSDIQIKIATKMSMFGDVPEKADPVDFAIFASMHAFVQVCTDPATQAKLVALEEKLAKFQMQSNFKQQGFQSFSH